MSRALLCIIAVAAAVYALPGRRRTPREVWHFPFEFPSMSFGNHETTAGDPKGPSTTGRPPTPPTTNCPCVATAEYNPVCGTDGVTYWNMGRFNCAKNCDPSLEIAKLEACEPYNNTSAA